MSNSDIFDRYLHALRKTPLEEKTEHADRSALEALMQALADQHAKGATVHHEPRRVADKGAPDFQVRKGGLILGYVENKGIGENLDKVLKSDQIKRYKELSDNILLTDYLHFIWIGKNGMQRETLCHATDLETPKFRLREERVAEVDKLLRGFFSTALQGIDKAQQLALALATRSKLLRDYLGKELLRQQSEHTEGRLYGLFEVFRKQVFHELTLSDFADAFAQMLAYGLFLARLNSGKHIVTLDNARQYVPGSFRLIRELVDFLSELNRDEYANVRWVVEEVLSIVNGLDLTAIHEDLSFRQRKAISLKVRAADEEEHRLFERDPFIYFYEDYLKAYDPKMRKRRGVYYTPPPIVNFIVRAVDELLKDRFDIHDGLADHQKVTVLDFACGTGTFLLEVFQRIFDNIGGPRTGRADPIVREHLLRNLFGFEYLIAPYTISHLKLSQYLSEQKHALRSSERLQIFLTNTLEPVEPQANFLLPAITEEVKLAQRVKEKPILVILGNPPYSAVSLNMGPHASASIEAYKFVDGVHFGERKHWLHDDYVKFIRFAQLKMNEVDEGIVGVITNHSWLENPTFRGMRQSLKTFNQIYVIDLHGNSKKKERAPDGSKDQNVFDIEQGVAISLFIKGAELDRGVWRSDLWGLRLDKYRTLSSSTISSQQWIKLRPDGPNFFFFREKIQERDEFNSFTSLPNILEKNVTGIVTARDGLVVGFTDEELKQRFADLTDPNVSGADIRKRYSVSDNYQWKLDAVRDKLKGEKFLQDQVQSYVFRPFDARRLYNDPRLVFRPRTEIMANFNQNNIGLLTTRITKDLGTVFCTEHAVGHKSASAYDITYIFPLFIYSDSKRRENLRPEFRASLDAHYQHHYRAEEIFGYVYAVLYAPSYRKRYAEQLRFNFPRIPLPKGKGAFDSLSTLGWALGQAHLLRQLPRKKLAAYHGSGDHTVDAVSYVPGDEAIAINKHQFFKPVPRSVWEFHIGGYQVLDSYLKSRKGRKLSLDEINHVSAVADSLAFTIDQMAKIDAAYRAAFPDQG